MAYLDLIAELRGTVPTVPFDYCKKIINRAWKDIRNNNLWSFQLYDGPNWIAPPLITAGTVTVNQGVNSVTFDATALAALIDGETNYSAITQRQFRVQSSGSPWGTIYNIWDFDSVTGIATLDRPFAERSGTDLQYNVFQCYFTAPYEDHLTFTTVRDMTNFNDLFLNKTRQWVDYQDPQRTLYFFPTYCVYYQQDQNTASNTYRWPMYELWGAPTYLLAWQLYGIRRYPDLVANSDTLPPAISEMTIMSQAKYYAYEWAEANKGSIPRNQGPDFKFLMAQAASQYSHWLKDDRKSDRETVNNWFSVRRTSLRSNLAPYYSTLSGTATPGGTWI